MSKMMRFVTQINRAMLYVTGLMVLLLTFFIFYDILMRYFFASPTRYGFDLSTWLTATIGFLSGGYGLLKNDHIRVDLFYANFSERTKSIVDILAGLCIFIMVIVLIRYGGGHVLHLYQTGSIASTGFNIALWIKWLIVPVGGILLGLQAMVNLINDISVLITGQVLWKEEQ